MKNISLNIAPYITSYVPSQSPQMPPPPFEKPKADYSVTFSAQFDNEKSARDFAKSLLIHLEDYNA